MYKIKVTARARRGLKILSKSHEQAVTLAIDELREDPTFGKPLGRELIGKFNLRVGVYRIIYKVNSKDRVVFIVNVDHREKAYN